MLHNILYGCVGNSGTIICSNKNGVRYSIHQKIFIVCTIAGGLCRSCNTPYRLRGTVHTVLGSLAPMVLRRLTAGGNPRHVAALYWCPQKAGKATHHMNYQHLINFVVWLFRAQVHCKCFIKLCFNFPRKVDIRFLSPTICHKC